MPRLREASTITPSEFRARRNRLGLSQKALSAGLGLSVSQIINYESGRDRHSGKPCAIPRIVALDLEALERAHGEPRRRRA